MPFTKVEPVARKKGESTYSDSSTLWNRTDACNIDLVRDSLRDIIPEQKITLILRQPPGNSVWNKGCLWSYGRGPVTKEIRQCPIWLSTMVTMEQVTIAKWWGNFHCHTWSHISTWRMKLRTKYGENGDDDDAYRISKGQIFLMILETRRYFFNTLLAALAIHPLWLHLAKVHVLPLSARLTDSSWKVTSLFLYPLTGLSCDQVSSRSTSIENTNFIEPSQHADFYSTEMNSSVVLWIGLHVATTTRKTHDMTKPVL